MITPKIKALFQFIEFLHSNIDNFKQYDEAINELHLLDEERQKVSSKKTFKDKLKYDEVREQFEDKFNIIQENILQPIRTKATELNICDLNKTETLYWNSTEIHELKEYFSKDDLPEIFSHKNKYLEYRTATKGEAFFRLVSFFDDLDEVLKTLFDFFKETEQNEFEAFETKVIQVNDIDEAVKLFRSGKFHKFTLPNNFLNPSTIQEQNNIEPLPPQQTETETEQGTPTFTNNFDNIKPTEIYKHFKAGLVEKGYLTEQELNEYLKAAFELKIIPETLFKLKHTPTKQKIYTVFYIYYKDIAQKKHERQKEYAALLGDFFEGYKTETIQTNWARDYKTKR